MAYTSDRTGASIDRVLDNADGVIDDSGNIDSPQIDSSGTDVTQASADAVEGGINTTGTGYTDLNDVEQVMKFFRAGFGADNRPPNGNYGGGVNIYASLSDYGTQIARQSSITETELYFRNLSNGTYGDWQHIWNSAGTGRTAASAAAVVDNADAGNIGKDDVGETPLLASGGQKSGFYSSWDDPLAPNTRMTYAHFAAQTASSYHFEICGNGIAANTGENKIYVRNGDNNNIYLPWDEIYHTGNTGTLEIGTSPSGTKDAVVISNTEGRINYENNTTSSAAPCNFYNPNGFVGNITTNASLTAYNTSSDPRLKSTFNSVAPLDAWNKFDDLLGCFGEYSFNADPATEIYGFNAHAVIDCGVPFIASEGEGGRIGDIGDEYEAAIPATFETQQQPILDEEGQPVLDEFDQPTFEDIEVELTPAIPAKLVTPAGIDHSKIVPYLMGVIDDLRNRVAALEGA